MEWQRKKCIVHLGHGVGTKKSPLKQKHNMIRRGDNKNNGNDDDGGLEEIKEHEYGHGGHEEEEGERQHRRHQRDIFIEEEDHRHSDCGGNDDSNDDRNDDEDDRDYNTPYGRANNNDDDDDDKDEDDDDKDDDGEVLSVQSFTNGSQSGRRQREHGSHPMSIADDYEAQLEQQRKQVKRLREKEAKAIRFLRVLQSNSNVFDAEDVAVAEQIASALQQERRDKENSLRLRQTIFRKHIKRMTDVIDTRKRVIDDLERSTGIFSENPDLLHQFAQKQAELKRSLDHVLQFHKQVTRYHCGDGSSGGTGSASGSGSSSSSAY